MNRLLLFIFVVILMGMLPFAHADGAYRYLCIVDGKPIYSHKIMKHAQCQQSHINGIGDAPAFDFAKPTPVSAHVALPPETPHIALTQQTQNWQKHQYYQYNLQNSTPMNRSTAAAVAMMTLALSPLSLPEEAHAQTTYICLIHGKPAYTTIKQGNRCSISTINGLAEHEQPSFAPQTDVSEYVALAQESASSPAVAEWGDDPISKIWHEYEYGSYDKTPILPPPPPKTEVVKMTSPQKVIDTNRPKIVFAPQISYQRPTAPTLTRRDILNNEIAREQTALKVAQTQLELARKKGDVHALLRLGNVVRDRQQNVQSLTRELQR